MKQESEMTQTNHSRYLVVARALKLIFACLVVGTILSMKGIRALDVLVYALKTWRSMIDMGLASIGAFASIIGLGAMIVIPVLGVYLIISRLDRSSWMK